MDLVDITLIILSALTVLFTLFLCFIAVIAFLGWTNFKDFKKRQEVLLAQKRKALTEADISIEESKKEMGEIIKDLKNKTKPPAELEEQSKRAEELIDRLKGAINKAEDRVDNLRISGITSSPYITSATSTLSSIYGEIINPIANGKKCTKCGGSYYNDNMATLISYCPHCGEPNF